MDQFEPHLYSLVGCHSTHYIREIEFHESRRTLNPLIKKAYSLLRISNVQIHEREPWYALRHQTNLWITWLCQHASLGFLGTCIFCYGFIRHIVKIFGLVWTYFIEYFIKGIGHKFSNLFRPLLIHTCILTNLIFLITCIRRSWTHYLRTNLQVITAIKKIINIMMHNKNNFYKIFNWILNCLDFLMFICTRENRCSLSLSVIEVSP